MKQINGYEVIQLFEQFSPKSFAMEGDKIGLQIGTLNKPIKNIMIVLDLLEEVVEEAIEKDVQLIIAHHPPIFRPLQKLITDTANGRIMEKLIKNDIAVYAAHTNLDVAEGGVNDLLADALGLKNRRVLVPTVDISDRTENKELGLGRIGELEEEMTLKEFAEHVKSTFEVNGVRVVGDLNSKIKKVAILGGDGNKYFSTAVFKGADVYVTGDIYYHVAHDAKMMGLNIVDPGHNIEKVMKAGVATYLSKKCEVKGYNVKIFPSDLNTDPFQFL